MKPSKLYVSVTRADGSFLVRGMASHPKTLEVFRTFQAERPDGRAFFALLSQHDGRLRVRPSTGELFEAEVIGSAARNATLWGLLPAKPEIALRSQTFSGQDVEAVIEALYHYGRTQFLHMVRQELSG